MLTLYVKHVSDANVITKINRMNFKNVIGDLNLGSVIYPRVITSEAIIAYVRAKKNSMNSNIETLYHLFDSRVEAIEFLVDEKSDVTDKPLMDLSLKDNTLVSCIYRNGVTKIPSFTAVAATINNIGPGLELVGPTQNFASFTVFSKLVLMFDMLAGRLELFPLLILFHPALIRSFFRRKK